MGTKKKVEDQNLPFAVGDDDSDEVKELKQRIATMELENAERLKDTGISEASSKRRVRIRIAEAHDENEPPRVFVGVNGRAYYIMRNRDVDVPPEVVEVLNNAIQERVGKHIDEKGVEAGIEFIEAHRFPFVNLGDSIDVHGNRLMPEAVHKVKTRLN